MDGTIMPTASGTRSAPSRAAVTVGPVEARGVTPRGEGPSFRVQNTGVEPLSLSARVSLDAMPVDTFHFDVDAGASARVELLPLPRTLVRRATRRLEVQVDDVTHGRLATATLPVVVAPLLPAQRRPLVGVSVAAVAAITVAALLPLGETHGSDVAVAGGGRSASSAGTDLEGALPAPLPSPLRAASVPLPRCPGADRFAAVPTASVDAPPDSTTLVGGALFGRSEATPVDTATTNGPVVIAGDDRRLHAFSTPALTPLWTSSCLDGAVAGAPLMVDGGRAVIAVTTTGRIARFTLSDSGGEQKPTAAARVGGGVRLAPSLFPGALVVTSSGADGDTVRVFEPTTLAQRSAVAVGARLRQNPQPVGGSLYVADGRRDLGVLGQDTAGQDTASSRLDSGVGGLRLQYVTVPADDLAPAETGSATGIGGRLGRLQFEHVIAAGSVSTARARRGGAGRLVVWTTPSSDPTVVALPGEPVGLTSDRTGDVVYVVQRVGPRVVLSRVVTATGAVVNRTLTSPAAGGDEVQAQTRVPGRAQAPGSVAPTIVGRRVVVAAGPCVYLGGQGAQDSNPVVCVDRDLTGAPATAHNATTGDGSVVVMRRDGVLVQAAWSDAATTTISAPTGPLTTP